ncbi:hypothetical protein [Bacillus safensis]|uniref:hypothetical protein n=1 Tax=Bacillus safensis TaxID=561879 RepID=UPI001BCE0D6D|nr:hypothetical protein [Bacillus safensis]
MIFYGVIDCVVKHRRNVQVKAMKHHKIALHYYTEQDFVRPRKIAQNGYRLFDEKKIDML